MAAATPTQVKNRVVALYALIAGITTSLDDYPEDGLAFEDAELPVAITTLGPATNTAFSKSGFIMTRTVTTHLLVASVEGSQSFPDTSAMEAVEPFMVSVPLFFSSRQQLDDPATGLSALVRNCTLPSEQEPGPGRFAYGGVDYWGLVLNMQVETLHNS